MIKIPKLTEAELAGLDANIRRTVACLRSIGYNTCDSGDGSKYPEMECALPVPNVFATVVPSMLIHESKRLYDFIHQIMGDPVMGESGPSWSVQADYSPNDDTATVALYGIGDDILFKGKVL